MDNLLLMRGGRRSPLRGFLIRLAPWAALLTLGIYSAYLILSRGLNQTNMDNRFVFGLWIFTDLGVIALGAGAFFTGALLYLLKRRELKAVINSAVVLGFICYSSAVVLLALDVGQPLRAWFTFWHPNAHSMLTEVTFCISCYLFVLTVEYLPVILRNRRLRQVPLFLVLEFQLHKVMPILAAIGAFLSFFHQGSLGGLFGVLRGRPFAYREGLALWPSTFFLFILSAAAVGPSFLLVITWIVSKVSGRRLMPPEARRLLARISGYMLLVYVALKGADTLVWINWTAPAAGLHPFWFYAYQPFGTWVLFSEIVLFGLLPALILSSRRSRGRWLVPAAATACAGVLLNRFVMTIQTLSLPTLAFDGFLTYIPSWQEVAAFAGILAYGVLVYSVSFRYLPLYAQERRLTLDSKAERHVPVKEERHVSVGV
ncbi:MAG: molybdopterin oxidoreductase [Candidatus Handelsmanbacteria bacterium RIFCSPLOWO2_12_FULL_64_10]|uniref:Molybdopterin oxidoreductase n=1 Tax=Handelsmanbacteria sp. (strain RIFCSPLOWO2_12_FULL_64_10) TaxID=1817868 RepID=A0A1F6C4A3_HANXR|nr:MAG: molybdopterin oxidoreductase [Candidatus Handelsmanbacteria bacterium RIFCSPLOWO2_12_FULL_64_10]